MGIEFIGLENPSNGEFCIINIKTQGEEKLGHKKTSGRMCKTWRKEELCKLIIRDLKIPLPGDVSIGEDDKKFLIDEIKSNKIYKKLNPPNLRDLEIAELQKLYYFLNLQRKKLCEIIFGWFRKNKLLKVDFTCGTSQKKKIK